MAARRSLVLIAGTVASAMLSVAAGAESLCANRGELVGKLGNQYKEFPTALGLASNGVVIEVLASPGGSFTIIATEPSGRTCAIAAGESWSDDIRPAAVVDSPS